MTSPFDRHRRPTSFLSLQGWPLAVHCPNPEAEIGDHVDICLTGVWCEEHRRTCYYCHELGVIWCDGLVGDETWQYHVLAVVPDEQI